MLIKDIFNDFYASRDTSIHRQLLSNVSVRIADVHGVPSTAEDTTCRKTNDGGVGIRLIIPNTT